MRKMRRVLWEAAALFLLPGLLIGCGAVTPPPTSPSMVRVVIQLDDVFCNGKQSVWPWQRDKFYMLTTFSASGPMPTSAVVTQSGLSTPIAIGNSQDLAIPPEPLVVFNALLPLDGTLRGGFTAFNGGISDDQVAQFATWVFTIAKQVGDQLKNDAIDSENLPLEEGATILSLGSQAFLALLGESNNPTQLGKQAIEITANGSQIDQETLSFVQNSGPGSTWNYVIHYTITRTFTGSSH